MYLKKKIKSRISEFLKLCNEYNVKHLYVFGSAVNTQFDKDNSDIDFIIELDIDDPLRRGESLMNLWDKLEHFFQRKIDLLTYSSIKNPVLKKNIDKTKILLYDGQEQKIFI
ncbi:MAG: nucleotidyltransferase domain-containing protein [Saprospiraceae bacterium]|nr:nucleotidyltransferase domain-containing protein [Saprospiraceae bacterium]